MSIRVNIRAPLRRVWIVAALLGMALVSGVAPAFAHAHLQSSEPVKGSTVTTALHEIVLTFSEAVTPAVVTVLDQDGHAVKTVGTPRADGNTVHLPLTAALPEGHYTVTYRVASADTHVATGSVVFAIARSVQ